MFQGRMQYTYVQFVSTASQYNTFIVQCPTFIHFINHFWREIARHNLFIKKEATEDELIYYFHLLLNIYQMPIFSFNFIVSCGFHKIKKYHSQKNLINFEEHNQQKAFLSRVFFSNIQNLR